jgi:hypothetical protein
VGQNRRTIDPDLFTDAQGAAELEANSLRESLAYDAYGTQTEFAVIVLTKPIPQSAADANAVFTGANDLSNSNTLEGGISFKGRIIGNGFISPHASIPDPCNLEMHASPGVAIKVINMHTTFTSVSGYSGRIPSIGDTVMVKLQAGDIKLNLQNAIFTEIFDATSSSVVANSMATNCTNLASRFDDFDPDEDLGDISVAYASFDFEGPRIPDITRTQAQPLIDVVTGRLAEDPSLLGYTPLESGVCGFPADFFGSDPTPAQAALIAAYPPRPCVTHTIGKTKHNSPARVTGHPTWIATLREVYRLATRESWWNPYVEENGVDPICFSSGYRSIETQIYLRMSNCGHRNYDEVMSVPTRPACNPPTARPGKSRHNVGLAIDFGGSLGASFSSEAHQWLKSKGLRGDGTLNIKNYQSEAWHWSVDGS